MIKASVLLPRTLVVGGERLKVYGMDPSQHIPERWGGDLCQHF